jgi:hypothetical protein
VIKTLTSGMQDHMPCTIENRTPYPIRLSSEEQIAHMRVIRNRGPRQRFMTPLSVKVNTVALADRILPSNSGKRGSQKPPQNPNTDDTPETMAVENYSDSPDTPEDTTEAPTSEVNTKQAEVKQRKLEELINEFPESLSESDYELGCSNIIQHRIDVRRATPVKSRAYRVNSTTQKIIDEHIENLLDCGIIRPSVSPGSSPVIVTLKNDGKTRLPSTEQNTFHRNILGKRKLSPKIFVLEQNLSSQINRQKISESLQQPSWVNKIGKKSLTFQVSSPVKMFVLSRRKSQSNPKITVSVKLQPKNN